MVIVAQRVSGGNHGVIWEMRGKLQLHHGKHIVNLPLYVKSGEKPMMWFKWGWGGHMLRFASWTKKI